MDQNQLDQEVEDYMRPLIDKLDISVESLEHDLACTEHPRPLTVKFIEIVSSFLRYALEQKRAPDISLYVLEFVVPKDTGLNALFFDGIRDGKWSPLYSHPLISTKWLPSSFYSRCVGLPTPLLDIVKAAHQEIPVKFERYRLGQNPSESLKRPAPLWLTVSFVRHGESQANAGHRDIMDPKLTQRGFNQALGLGSRWSNTRIDKLYLSDTTRARETAEGFLQGRSGKIEQEEKEILVEQDYGEKHKALMRDGSYNAAHRLRTDDGRAVSIAAVRRPYRTPGGESQKDVARRAQLALLHLIFDHGVQLPSPPEQVSDDSRNWGGSLIEGIPHLLVVSHNLFLSELFESLGCWEKPTHFETRIDYRNAGWTRHLLRLDWPGDDDYDENSYRGFWFGLRLSNWYTMGV